MSCHRSLEAIFKELFTSDKRLPINNIPNIPWAWQLEQPTLQSAMLTTRIKGHQQPLYSKKLLQRTHRLKKQRLECKWIKKGTKVEMEKPTGDNKRNSTIKQHLLL